ncbi:MAG: hypothetical protein JST54_32195 [Deltaproteobacteria bacterium]|nr:hypothetical protein [Deltaproteobacteria bacterium]
MIPNPHQPPIPADLEEPSFNRRPFVLAAVASGLASAYWGVLTLLIVLGAGAGNMSPLNVVLPILLIFLYAQRAMRVFNGDRSAASRLIGLHLIGGLMTVMRLAAGGFLVLYVIKLVIHIFGALTAYSASRAQ